MALFSGETKITVGTSVNRVLEDNMVPDAAKAAVINSVFRNQGMADSLLTEVSKSIGIRADRMYRYAAESYPIGLPTGEFTSTLQGYDEVVDLLNQIHGGEVAIQYVRIGVPNLQHTAWKTFLDSYAFNFDTKKVSNLLPGLGGAYLLDFKIYVTPSMYQQLNDFQLQHWGNYPLSNKVFQAGIAHPPIEIFGDISLNARVVVKYGHHPYWENANSYINPELYEDSPDLFIQELTLPLTGFDEVGDFYQVLYTHNTRLYAFTYKVGTGVYPTLDAVYGVPDKEVIGEFFPMIYFRTNRTSMATQEGSPTYLASKKMLKTLNMSYADLIEKIHENPDIDDVEEAFLFMGISPESYDQREIRYLYDFFDRLQTHQAQKYEFFGSPLTLGLWTLAFGDTFGTPKTLNDYALGSMIIQDSQSKMAFTHKGIIRKVRGGSIASVGGYALEKKTNSVAAGGFTTLVYKKQVSQTLYEELEVVDLQMIYYIDGGYRTFGNADEGTKLLLVPIDKTVVENYNIAVREFLYAKSIHLVFHSKLITKVAWYQTGAFLSVVQVVGIFLAVFTAGQSAIAAFTASVASAGLTSALLTLALELIVIPAAIAFAAGYVVQAIGVKNAAIVAIIAAAAVMIYAGSTTGGFESIPWASDVMTASNALFKGASDYLNKELAGISGELQALTEQDLMFQEELSEANNLLEQSNILSPYTFLGEFPENYYNRTTNIDAIYSAPIDAIQTFAERSLKLPEAYELLGNLNV